MFRRSSSPFPPRDHEMWDSRYTAQTSSWYGASTVSGSGFLSKVNTSSSSGSSGSFRQTLPGIRKWQSVSHLVPEGPSRAFTSSPEAELHLGLGGSSFRQSEVMQWLQDAHERIDTQFDRLRARDGHLNFNTTSELLRDMKQKLAEVKSPLEQEKETAGLFRSDKNLQQKELHEKILKLEKDLLQMRSTMDRGGSDQPSERPPSSNSTTPPANQADLDRQKVDREMLELREALKEAEAKAKTHEEERNQALKQLQTSTETQETLQSQMEELNQRLGHTVSDHTDVQEQLSDANNRISQACLEKAILSTQVLKLEDNIKELEAKLKSPLSDKDQQQAPDGNVTNGYAVDTESHNNHEPVLTKEEPTSEVNDKLSLELDTMKQKLDASQSEVEELREEAKVTSKQIMDLQAERSELVRQREGLLSTMSAGEKEMKERCRQLRESVASLELEKHKFQDQCLCLESEVLEMEEKLQHLEERFQKQDAARVRNIQELKAVAAHWTEKWQRVALTLQSTQEEMEDLKKNAKNGKDSESLLRIELEACKQQLDLEKSRSRTLIHRQKDEGGEAARTQDKETLTDFSEPSSPSPSADSHNKSPQVRDENTGADVEDEPVGNGENTEQVNKGDDDTAADQSETVSPEEWSPTYSTGAKGAADRWGWQQKPGLMPVLEEDEESDGDPEGEEEGPGGETDPEENLQGNMSTVSAGIGGLKAETDGQPQVLTSEDQHTAAEETKVPLTSCSDERDPPEETPPLYPDGIFQAELVCVCSNDEDEEKAEGE